MHSKRWGGRRALWLLMMAALLCGCGTAPAASAYRVLIPTLQAPPREVACVTAAGADAARVRGRVTPGEITVGAFLLLLLLGLAVMFGRQRW
jgi:hypothetical protein